MAPFVRRLVRAVRRRHALVASWRRLSPAERRDVAAFALLIPSMAFSLRVAGFRRTKTLFSRSIRTARGDKDAGASAGSLVRALQRAGRYAPYRGNCLSQSFALWSLLRRRGVPCELCLGARLDDRLFSAHAWVECGGRAINDTPDVRQRFTVFQPAASRQTSTAS